MRDLVRVIVIACAATAPAVFAPALPAQNRVLDVPKDTASLQPVVITATKDSVNQAAPTAATTVITGMALRASGIATVQQALNVISSVTTVQAGSFGATTSLFTRGGQSNYTLVLVDGAPVNDPGGFADLANLTTDNVDRIEVVRGPGSVLYGADAISGVIQIFTRRAAHGTFANVAATGGSYGARTYDLGFGAGKESMGISLDAARYRSNGILPFNNGASNDVFSGLLRFGAPGSAHITLSGRQMKSDYHFPTDFTGAITDSAQQTSGRLTVGSADAGFYMGSKLEFRVLGTYTENKSTSSDTPDSPGDTVNYYYVDPSTLSTWSADARLAIHINRSTAITAGGMYEDQSSKFGDSSWAGTGAPMVTNSSYARNNTGYYANATGDFGAKFSYNAGLRYTSSAEFGDFTTYRVGAGWVLSPKTSLRGSLGTAFREPSLYEEYAQGFAMGNPFLKPELGKSWEIGIDQSFGEGKTRVAATYFSQRFTDMIQYDPNVPPGTPNYANIAAATASGIEAELHAKLSPQWAFDAAYTWLSTNVVDAGTPYGPTAALIPGQPLLRRPANAGNAGLTYLYAQKLTFSAQLVYVGSRSDIDYTADSRVTLPSYLLVNGSALLILKSDKEGRFLALTFRGTNLLNHGYQQTSGFAAPGRTLLVGFRIAVEQLQQ